MNFLIALVLVLSSVSYASTKGKDTPSSAAGFQAIYPGTVTKITVTGTTARMGAGVGTAVTIFRVICTEDSYIKVGNSTVNATTNDVYLPADTVEYFGIQPGQYVAAIRDTVSGTCHIAEGQ